MVNALGLRVFRREVSPSEAESSLSDFENDLRDGFSNCGRYQSRSSTERAICRGKPPRGSARAQRISYM